MFFDILGNNFSSLDKVIFKSHSELIKHVSAKAAQPGILFFLTFWHHFIEMHLLEGPDKGHSMIYYDGKVRKERKEAFFLKND